MTVSSSPKRSEQELLQTQFWLRSLGLTTGSLPIDFRDSHGVDPATLVLTLPLMRAAKHKDAELKQLGAK